MPEGFCFAAFSLLSVCSNNKEKQAYKHTRKETTKITKENITGKKKTNGNMKSVTI
jgi:hypothetical protein